MPGFKDKKLSEDLGRKLERLAQFVAMNQPPDADVSGWLQTIDSDLKAKLAKWGMLDARAVAEAKPLTVHLDDFEKHLLGKGNTAKHVQQTTSRVRSAIDGCKFVFPSDLDGGDLHDWLAGERDGGMSVQTSNHYLTNARGFSRWMVRDKRLNSDPFNHLQGLNVRTDRRRERRSLSAEDFQRLIETTRNSQAVFRRLTGEDRAVLYLMAARTGLRVNEIATLTTDSLSSQSDPPTVQVVAANEKARRGCVMPLSAELARELSDWLTRSQEQGELATVAINAPKRKPETIWPGTWSERSAKMLRKDLESARSAWIKEATDDGRVFNFHALRAQFITDLGRAGVSLQDAQKLARHSDPKLTASVYTHLSVSDLSQSVNKLPTLPPAMAEPMKATGTDDEHVGSNRLTNSLAKPDAEQCRIMPKIEQSDSIGNLGPEMKKNRESQGNRGFFRY